MIADSDQSSEETSSPSPGFQTSIPKLNLSAVAEDEPPELPPRPSNRHSIGYKRDSLKVGQEEVEVVLRAFSQGHEEQVWKSTRHMLEVDPAKEKEDMLLAGTPRLPETPFLRKPLPFLSDVTERLPSSKRNQAAIKIQNMCRGFLARRRFHARKRLAARRTAIFKEIIDTERSYIHHLKVLATYYIGPLRNGLLTADQDHSIFGDVDRIILPLNEQLLSNLEKRYCQWSASSTKISDIFIGMGAFFKLYTSYVTRFDTALSHIALLRKNNKKFKSVVDRASEIPECAGLGLLDLLVTPVQRLMRYPMLLGAVVDATWSSHSDYEGLLEALHLVSSVAEAVNEKKRELENLERIMAIQHSLIHEKGLHLVEPHRRFVAEFDLMDISKDFMLYHLILCNDILICTKNKKGKLKFKWSMTLDKSVLVDEEDDSNLVLHTGQDQRGEWRVKLCNPRLISEFVATMNETSRAWETTSSAVESFRTSGVSVDSLTPR